MASQGVDNDFIKANRLKQIAQEMEVIEVARLKEYIFDLHRYTDQCVEYGAQYDG